MNILKIITTRILLAVLVLLSFLTLYEVQASVNNSDKTIVIHYARYDAQAHWSVWLWSSEPIIKSGDDYSFTSTDSFGQVLTLPLANTQFQDASKVGIIIRDSSWNKDISIDRFFDLTFDENNELHLYVVQATEEIFTSEEAAINELQKYNYVEFDGLKYLTTQTTAKIIGRSSNRTSEYDLVIPNSISVNDISYDVTSIGDGAFRNDGNLKTVTIGANIQSIESHAFSSNNALTNVTFLQNSNLKRLHPYAFSSIYNLSELLLPNGLEQIDENAFHFITNLEVLYIPSSVSIVANDAVNLGENFYPELVIATESQMVNWDPDWNPYNIKTFFGLRPPILELNNFIYFIENDEAHLRGIVNANDLVEINVPETITIGSTNFPVTSIQGGALRDTWQITTIQIPSSITYIHPMIWGQVANVTEFVIDSNNPSYSVVDGIIFSKNLETLVHYPRHLETSIYTLPASVTRINDYAFYGNRSLRNVNFEENSNLTSVGVKAFANTRIRWIHFPSGLEELGRNAFSQSTNLYSIYLPSSLVRVGRDSLKTNIHTIISYQGSTVPNSWDSVIQGTIEFDRSSGIQFIVSNNLIYLIDENEASVAGFLISPTSLTTLTLPESIDLDGVSVPITAIYNWAFVFENNLTDVVISSNIERILSAAFVFNSQLKSVTFAANGNLTEIARNAFSYTNVSEIIIPAGVTTIEREAFSFISSLRSVHLPASVSFVGHNAFKSQDETSIVIGVQTEQQLEGWDVNWNPNNHDVYYGDISVSIVEINSFTYLLIDQEAILIAYQNSVVPDPLVIPSSITFEEKHYPVREIGNNVFNNAHSVTTIVIPETVETISPQAFIGLHNLQNFDVSENNNHYMGLEGVLFNASGTVLANYPPQRQGSIYTMPNTVETIERSAFSGNQLLRSIEFPADSKLKNIRSYAFQSVRMNYLLLPSGVTTIEDNAFSYVQGMSVLSIPSTVESMGKNVISSSNKLDVYVGLTEEEVQVKWPLDWFNSTWYVASNLNIIYGQSGMIDILVEDNLNFLVLNEKAYLTGFETLPTEQMALVIPNTVGLSDYPVVEILSSAFQDAHLITAVSFPDNVQVIGMSAFQHLQGLEHVQFSVDSQLRRIERNAFFNSNNLKDIVLPNQLEFIGSYSFAFIWQLSSVMIPASVTMIEDSAFRTWDNYNRSATIIVGSEEQTTNWNTRWNPQNFPVFYSDSITFFVDDVFKYWVIDDEATIVGFKDNVSNASPVFPSFIELEGEQIPVTSIGASAFINNEQITDLLIPSNIITIEARAFQGNYRLVRLRFSENSSLESIQAQAFSNTNIASLVLPRSLKTIGFEAFWGNGSLTTIEFESNSTLHTLGGRAFAWSSRISSIRLPASLQVIQPAGLAFMTNLVSISIPESNQNFKTVDGVLYNKNGTILIAYPLNKSNKLFTIPTSVIRIESNAFSHSRNIEEVIFEAGSSLKTIGDNAFNWSSLKLITLPEGLEKIEYYAFYGVTRMSYISLPGSLVQVDYRAFGGSPIQVFTSLISIPQRWSNQWLDELVTVNLGQNVTLHSEANMNFLITSGQATFLGITNEYTSTSLIIPSTITSNNIPVTVIGNSALFRNQSITELTIPSSVISIQSQAFSQMTRLTSVNFASGSQLEFIGRDAFSNTAIIEMRIPDSVTHISEYAFAWNIHLSMVYIPRNVVTINYDAFSGGNEQMLILVETDVKPPGWHQNWMGWRSKAVIWDMEYEIVVQDFIRYVITKDIEAKVVGVVSEHPTHVNIPASITINSVTYPVVSILNGAFANNLNIRELTVTSGIKTIHSNSFYRALNLSQVNIPISGLVAIGEAAFQETRLNEFILPKSVKSIGNYAFSFMQSIETFTISEDSVLETLGDGVFQWSSNIRRIFIPELVSGITVNPLRGVHQLEEIVVSSNNPSLFTQSGILFERHGDVLHIVAYASRYNNQTLVIPNTVSVIGQDAIRDAWMLESILFEAESQLVELKSHAIIGTNIRSIRLPGSLTSIGEYGLAWNWNLQALYIDSGVTSVGRNAVFAGNNGMEIFIKEESQVATWDSDWNPDNKTVIFGEVTEIQEGLFKYRITPEAVILVGAADGASYPNELIIPSSIMVNGVARNVTVIGASILGPQSNVSSLIISSTIERINAGAFRDAYQLQKVEFDQSTSNSVLNLIGNAAFRNVGIQSITIPASVIEINDEAFAASYQLSSVNFENGSQLEKIGSHAFSWLWQLTSFTIPSQVNFISPKALTGNGNLASIDVENNPYFSSSSGVLFNNTGTRLIAYPTGNQNPAYTVPESVVVIEESAFEGARFLQSLTFAGNNLTQIGRQAFSNSSIRTLTLPDGVLEIRDYAFSWNYNLVIVSIPDSVEYLGYDLFNGTNDSLIVFVEAETIPATWGQYWNQNNRKVILNSYVQAHSEGGIEYIISNDEAMVFGVSHGTNNTQISIPSTVTYEGNIIPVTSIASSAFSYNRYLQSITIPGSVELIGASAFSNNYHLTSVTFSENSGLIEIGKRAFENTSITSFTLPQSVELIDDFAFASNYALQTLDLSSGLKLTKIGQFAFAWTGIQSVTIPSGVTIIDDYAFHNAYGLSSLSFAEGSQLQTIGQSSFAWIYNLTTIEIPAHVSLIKESAFRGTSSLISYTVDPLNTHFSSQDGVLFNHNKTRLIAYPSAKNDSSYTMPNNVTVIESDAFTNAYYLQEITLSNALTTIRRNAFTYTSLSRITLPSSLIRIEDYAFFGNWLLREVVIPESVTHVGFHSFRHLNHNAVLRVQAAAIPSTWNTQWNPDRIFTLLGNEQIVTIGDFVYSISFDNVVTVIGLSDAGAGKSVLSVQSSITDSNLAVTKIGDNAFMNTTIETITLPNSITSIGNSSFKNIFTLSGVILHPDSQLITIGSEAFANSSLLSMTIPRSVTLIEEKAFENAYQLAQVIFAQDSQLTTIKAHAFAWNPVITSFDLPNSLTSIAENAFSSNRSLIEITIDNEYYYSSGGVLFNADLTTLIHYPSAKADADYVIPSSVTRISPFAFRDSQFTSVTLPQGLATIGDYAFFGNSGLVSITIPSSVTYMGNEVFNSSNASLITINNLAVDNMELWHEDWNTNQ